MDERKIYQARSAGDGKRDFEWVDLPDGVICIWSLSMAEGANIQMQSKRPGGGSQIDQTKCSALEVLISAYTDEPGQKDARKVFGHIDQVYELPWAEFRALVEGAMKANGRAPADLEGLKAFTEARQDLTSASSPSSA